MKYFRVLIVMVFPILFISMFVPPTTDGQELRHKLFLSVFDANGKKVGSVISIDANNNPLIAFKLDGQIFVIGVSPGRFEIFGATNPLFESGDCSSIPFLATSNPPPLMSIASISGPGNTVYLPISGSIFQTVAARSFLDRDGGCIAFSSPTTFINARQGQPVINLSTVFTPPFSVR